MGYSFLRAEMKAAAHLQLIYIFFKLKPKQVGRVKLKSQIRLELTKFFLFLRYNITIIIR